MSDPDIYTVGWVSATIEEAVAASLFLDERHDRPKELSPKDTNDYQLGRIGEHSVVIAVLPFNKYGAVSAATVASDMIHSFPNVRIVLMVGTGGGVPSGKHDIRLGDIVVGVPKDGRGGVIQYDYGRAIHNGDFRQTGYLNQPPQFILTAVSGLATQYEIANLGLDEIISEVLEGEKKLKKKYSRPAPNSDRLYKKAIKHQSDDNKKCVETCGDDPLNLITRSKREETIVIHYGLIASANQVMNDSIARDKLSEKERILCFEMEAAGLMDRFPCLVIRGICDYADSHSNNEWRGYAAMAAAAYAKDLVCRLLPSRINAEKKISDVISSLFISFSTEKLK